jgi:hypothetical protein
MEYLDMFLKFGMPILVIGIILFASLRYFGKDPTFDFIKRNGPPILVIGVATMMLWWFSGGESPTQTADPQTVVPHVSDKAGFFYWIWSTATSWIPEGLFSIFGLVIAVGVILLCENYIKNKALTGTGEKSFRTACYMITSLVAGFIIWTNLGVGITGFLNQVFTWVSKDLLRTAGIVAAIITTVALGAGTKKVWEAGPTVTLWLVYLIAGSGIFFVLYYIGTEMIFDTSALEQRGYHKDG